MLFSITITILCLASISAENNENLQAGNTRALEVCYGDHGCFKTTAPFGGTLQRPFFVLPDQPAAIGTAFYLYTRATRKNRVEISRSTTLGTWDVNKPTKICIHGFVDSSTRQWWIDMKNAILAAEDVNVIMTDWSKGNGFPYEKAAANTQVVGAEIALLVKYMIEQHGAKAADFHIIGHSLGGHTAGYAGSRIPGLGRITGLDPAGPYFEKTGSNVSLDPTDASYVDVIHTDGSHNLLLGLGSLERMGHADFFPNGGLDQPSCPKTGGKIINLILQLGQMNVQGFIDTSLCSHLSAVYYFTDSIRNQCPYIGYSCSSFDDFVAGSCSLNCDERDNKCNRMGYWASPSKVIRNFYLKTQDANAFPYCIYHYQVSLKSGLEFAQTRGKVSVTLIGTLQTVNVVFDNDATVFKRDSVQTRLIPLQTDIGEVTGIDIQFTKTTDWLAAIWFSSTWKFTQATVINGDQQQSRTFCPNESVIQSGSSVRYASC